MMSVSRNLKYEYEEIYNDVGVLESLERWSPEIPERYL
jgi:hypothetical protein